MFEIFTFIGMAFVAVVSLGILSLIGYLLWRQLSIGFAVWYVVVVMDYRKHDDLFEEGFEKDMFWRTKHLLSYMFAHNNLKHFSSEIEISGTTVNFEKSMPRIKFAAHPKVKCDGIESND